MLHLRCSQFIFFMGIISLAYSQSEILDDPGFDAAIESSDWICHGSCTAVLDADSQAGSNSVLIKDRTAIYNGPKQQLVLDENAVVGRSYHISGFAKIRHSQTNQQEQTLFIMIGFTLQDETKRYRKTKTVNHVQPSDGWVDLSADYTFPDFGQPLTKLDLYVAGPEPGIEFQVDTMSVKMGEVLYDPGFDLPIASSAWEGNGACTAKLSDDSQAGSNSVLITNTLKIWNGPIQQLKLDENAAVGKAYHISGYAKILPSIGNQQGQTISITIVFTLQDGTKKYRKTRSRNNVQPSDGWVDLSADYTFHDFGEPLTRLELYVAGPEAGVNFLVDTMSVKLITQSNCLKTLSS